MADTLIRGGSIVSMDEAVGDLDGDILVRDGRIAAIGQNLAAGEDAQIIDARDCIVMPGFVNAHIHAWQAGLRGVAADWTITEYLRAMHAGLATFFTPKDIYIANLCSALTQLHCGTTTLVDWCHNNPTPEHTDAAIDGLQASGARALFLHGSPKPDPKPGQKHFSELPMPRDEVERLRKGRLSKDDALVTLGLAILGPGFGVYDVAETDFRLAHELDLVASMHVSGFMLAPDGFERLAQQKLLADRFNIVHGNILKDDTLKLLVDHGVSFTVTAEVEMQMSFGRPLTGRLRALGSPITIGSDIESGMVGDMFGVTRMTLQAQRFVDALDHIAAHGKGLASISIPAREALRWSTIDAARMARLDHRIGSLKVGKAADIVLLRARDPNLHPVVDPAAAIVLHAGPGNVDTVLVDGVVKKRHGALVDARLAAHQDELAASSARILGRYREAVAAH